MRSGTPVITRSATRRPIADRKSTRLNSSHSQISYAVFCLKKKRRHVDVTAEKDEMFSQRRFYIVVRDQSCCVMEKRLPPSHLVGWWLVGNSMHHKIIPNEL